MCFNIKAIKRVCTFPTKICDLIKTYVHHGKENPCKEVEYGYILKKHSDYCGPKDIDLIKMLENYITFYNTTWIMPILGKLYIFTNFFRFLMMSYPTNLVNEFLCIISGYVSMISC